MAHNGPYKNTLGPLHSFPVPLTSLKRVPSKKYLHYKPIENLRKMIFLIETTKKEIKAIGSIQSPSGSQLKVYWGSNESAPGVNWCCLKWTLVQIILIKKNIFF